MSSEYDTVDVSVAGGLGRVQVTRPDAMNAVNKQVLDELADAIESTTAEARVVTITGAGEAAFIGGGDIKEFQDRSAVWFRTEFRTAMEEVEAAIEDSRVPVIAAVNGAALGGGTEIALMCDLIIAAESAVFGFPEITLGIIPGSGGTQRITELVGYLKAKELVLTGKQVSADEAAEARAGLADVLNGERDTFTPVYVSREMAELIEGSELLVVPDGTHVAPLEVPTTVNRAVVSSSESPRCCSRGLSASASLPTLVRRSSRRGAYRSTARSTRIARNRARTSG
jgi:enoyl-CoA hydratase